MISDIFVWYARKEFLSRDMIKSKKITIWCARKEFLSQFKISENFIWSAKKNFWRRWAFWSKFQLDSWPRVFKANEWLNVYALSTKLARAD